MRVGMRVCVCVLLIEGHSRHTNTHKHTQTRTPRSKKGKRCPASRPYALHVELWELAEVVVLDGSLEVVNVGEIA